MALTMTFRALGLSRPNWLQSHPAPTFLSLRPPNLKQPLKGNFASPRFIQVCQALGADDELAGGDGEGEAERGQWDVSSNCVTPVFRNAPLASKNLDEKRFQILFLSEGNVCRSVYAEAIFSGLLRQRGLQDLVKCSSTGTRDYNVGEAPDPQAVLVCEELGQELPKGKVATVFNCSNDIVEFDLLLVMDKFTASDVLKEVTVYEIVNKKESYSRKVRRLGEFCQTQQIEDIDDPLYGNMGGAEELALIREIYAQIYDSCEGLIEYIIGVQTNLQETESFKDGMATALGQMEALNWLAPPMLSKA